MKSIFRDTLINASSLFILSTVLPGVSVTGGLSSYLIGGLFLCLAYKILKPILNIISLPLNIITLGATSFFINVLIFYLATSLVPQISIREFTFPGLSFSGFIVPIFHLNTFFAYISAALLQSVLVSFVSWLRK